MTVAGDADQSICAVYVDMGTTNTRSWLAQGSRIIARSSRPTGVRDSARTGTSASIHEALRDVIREVRANAASCVPICVAAAGMISSPLGLAEVPHIPAPAGIDELASAARWFEFEDVTDLPILLVPGVRSGPPHSGIEHVDLVDVMRGEETLCAGLNALGIVRPPLTVLNLGSHWKAIRIDREGRVESSVTSLSGELIHAVQMHTILASSVPQDRPAALNAGWVERGMALQRKSGLARALFCVRLLELARDGTPEDRLAFLVGAFIASDLDALLARGMLASGTDVAIIGSHAIPEAWQTALAQKEINTTLLSAEDAENAFVAALRLIAARSCAARKKQRAC